MSAAPADRLRALGQALALAGAVLGLLGLAGWLWGVKHLVAVIPGRAPMMPATGALLLLAGLAAALRAREAAPRWRRGAAIGAGAAVVTASVVILFEYGTGTDLGVDRLPFPAATPEPYPGRPSPPTALALAVLGGALLVFDAAPRLRQWLSLSGAALAFAALVGHVYGATIFYRLARMPYIGVALHTAAAILLIAAGVLLARPGSGLMRLVTSPGPGGLVVRRLGAASLLTPVAVGVLLTRGLSLAEVGDLPVILSILTTAMAVIGASLVVAAARPLERSHGALEASRAGYRDLLEQAPDPIFMADVEGRFTGVNGAGCRLLQRSREEILGRTITDFIPSGDAARLWETREDLLAGGIHVGEWDMCRKDGSLVPVEVSARILPDGRWQGFLRDLTQRRAFLAEKRYFASAGEALASTLDHREMMSIVARSSVPFLGDACGVLVSEDGQLLMEVRHADEALRGVVEALARREAMEGGLLRRTFESRKPALLRDVTPAVLARFARDEEHLGQLRRLGPGSIMAVPLVAHGRCHGAMLFVSASGGRRYGADDLRVAEELGRRFALAVDNAFLYEQLRLQATIAAHLAEGVLLVRADDELIVYTNPRFDEMFGYGPGELLGRHVAVINAPGALSAREVADEIHWRLRTAGVWHGEIENIKKDGTRFWCYASVSTFDHPRLGPVWVAVRTDITERKRLEEERAVALGEKEVLLKEIHHRVKNSLQVISSLFYLQAQRTKDPRLRPLLDESRGRVQSIALVHDQLYRSRSLARIDFGEYLRSLVAGIEATYGASAVEGAGRAGRIGVRVEAGGVFLDIEHAVPCGLLVSELVSNAYKHAFPGDRGGQVRVAVREEGKAIVLEVADDGVGIPEGIDFRGRSTLGLQLVDRLTKQLRGVVTLARSSGTHFTVRFRPRRAPGEA